MSDAIQVSTSQYLGEDWEPSTLSRHITESAASFLHIRILGAADDLHTLIKVFP